MEHLRKEMRRMRRINPLSCKLKVLQEGTSTDRLALGSPKYGQAQSRSTYTGMMADGLIAPGSSK